jgi:DMSO/TMAO reductase YedYZ molybdopterin-dependent catalytic subunit
VLGLAWTLNLISFDLLWGYSPMNVHVVLGIGLLPFAGWHAWLRRRANRVSAPVRSRRAAVRLAALAAAGVAGWVTIGPVAAVLNGTRLPSGSKKTSSLSANDYPAEIWLFDSVPDLDATSWRLRLGDIDVSMDDLTRLPSRGVRAVLDCTSGWWTEQVWSGVSLVDLLAVHGLGLAGGLQVTVTSVTGHRIVFALEDLRDAVLATHVGGEVLSPGHGYPVRLVVPGRRGYQWVKWVGEIRVA